MPALTRADLWSLEEYSQMRSAFRERVLAHKKTRQVALGEHMRLYFEDALTIRYQIQEMLRIEKVFETHAINEELDAYSPLIPDGQNWKATFMIEYEDPAERERQLARLIGIEDRVWVQVGNHPRIHAIADEDLPRENAQKTASVHFLRFELTQAMVAEVHGGVAVRGGIDHPAYSIAAVEFPDVVRASLARDLQAPVIN